VPLFTSGRLGLGLKNLVLSTSLPVGALQGVQRWSTPTGTYCCGSPQRYQRSSVGRAPGHRCGAEDGYQSVIFGAETRRRLDDRNYPVESDRDGWSVGPGAVICPARDQHRSVARGSTPTTGEPNRPAKRLHRFSLGRSSLTFVSLRRVPRHTAPDFLREMHESFSSFGQLAKKSGCCLSYQKIQKI